MMVDNYYKTKAMLEQKLLEELNRHKAINKYAKKMIMEQDAPPAPPTDDAAMPPADDSALPPMDDTMAPSADDTSVPPPPTDDLDGDMGGDTEEIDITDLVNMTKSIKKDIDDNKNDNSNVIGQMDSVFSKLGDLEQKLSSMDSVIAKIDELGTKIQNMKEPTAQERLEMRSLDSYPFNQNPQQFFAAKQGEMRQSGKNEYVLTKQDVQDYSADTVKTSFNPENQQDEYRY
jgi:hypothetical protein